MMKANRNKLELAMAKACMSTAELQKAAEMPRPTLNNRRLLAASQEHWALM